LERKLEIAPFRLEEIDAVAAQVLATCKPARIFLIYGEMGAGKTSFVQACCRVLGTVESARSPSFSLVNEYHTAEEPVYHFDLYRLSGEAEAESLGLEEFWDSGSFCFVEWPEVAPALLPEQAVRIYLNVVDSLTRSLHLIYPA